MMQIGMKLGFPYINQNIKCPNQLYNFADGSNVLNSSITFSRSSNGTIVNSEGNIAYAPHNLLTNSESFEASAWAKTITTVTSNSLAAPDGTITADTLTATGANSTVLQTFTALAQPYTYSVYLYRKTGTGNIAITVDGTTWVTKTINAGWTRVDTTLTPAAGSKTAGIRIATSADEVYAWGAQLEVGTSPTAYNPTTPKNLLGFTEEFDNAAWTKSNSFVQTNLLTYSEAFDNAIWVKTKSTITSNLVTSPNGSTTADKIVEDTSLGVHYVNYSTSALSAVAHTASIYAKASEHNCLYISFAGGGYGSYPTAKFNLTTGVATKIVDTQSLVISIQNVGNGWYRCNATATGTTTATTNIQYFEGTDASYNYTGDGVSGLYIWGAQLVQGATAGDYARTDSTTMPVRYTAPNGFANAQKLVENTANSTHAINESYSSSAGTYTLSCYLKSAERTTAHLQLSDGATGSIYANINLSAGLVTSTVSGSWTNAAVSIISIGNGWYRASVTGKQGAGATLFPTIGVGSSTAYTGDGTSGIYIYGAQLSNSASLDPYVYNPAAALTSVAYYAPRFTYDPVTLAPQGLLIEEARTNLYTYSEQLDNAAWNQTRLSVSTNAITAPSGGTTADLLIPNVGSNAGGCNVYQSLSTTTGTSYSVSCYAKSNGGTITTLSFFNANLSGSGWVNFILTGNGSVTYQGAAYTATITKVGGDWYKCTLTATATATSTVNSIWYIGGVTTVVGDGTSGIYFWGAQQEAGAFATSYIPTGASSVTRAADVAVVQGNNFANWWNKDEGSLYTRANPLALGTYRILNINDGTGSNRILVSSINTSGQYLIQVGGVSQSDIIVSGGYTANSFSKQASAYKINDFASYVNGVAGTPDTSGSVPPVTNLAFSSFNGTISQFNYYNKRLVNSTLQSITA